LEGYGGAILPCLYQTFYQLQVEIPALKAEEIAIIRS
jgi:hypothetical protein